MRGWACVPSKRRRSRPPTARRPPARGKPPEPNSRLSGRRGAYRRWPGFPNFIGAACHGRNPIVGRMGCSRRLSSFRRVEEPVDGQFAIASSQVGNTCAKPNRNSRTAKLPEPCASGGQNCQVDIVIPDAPPSPLRPPRAQLPLDPPLAQSAAGNAVPEMPARRRTR